MAKWEHRPVLVNGTYIEPVPFGSGGKGDAPFQEYPKGMYRAESADGGPRICAYVIAKDEHEQRMLEGTGFAETQERAIERIAEVQLEMAKLAANRAHQDRWMGQKAKDEAAVVDEATMQHLAVIPETPIKRRGRARGSKNKPKTAEG